jgi:hypothetical protein
MALSSFKSTVLMIAALWFHGLPVQSQIIIQDIDTSAVEGLNNPAQAFERIPQSSIASHNGIEFPLVGIRGTSDLWYLDEYKLRKWSKDFPRSLAGASVIELSSGTSLGAELSTGLGYIKRPTDDHFKTFAAAQGLYWYSHLEGTDIVFGKFSKDGPLMVLQDETFVLAPFPEQGHTRLGEFLPWYSQELHGLFTVWRNDLWFLRDGETEWRRVEGKLYRTAPSWGFYQRESQEFLSPNAALLKVISKNSLRLGLYEVENGYPTHMGDSFYGMWRSIETTEDIVGWRGIWSKRYFSAAEKNTRATVPQLVKFSPNAKTPKIIEGYQPLILLQNEKSISYQYEFETMPGTDRLYFLHSDGFGYFSEGEVIRLPESWLETVGKLPKFFKSHSSLYVGAKNGLFQITDDDQIKRVLRPDAAGFSLGTEIHTMSCNNTSLGFVGFKTGVYIMRPDGEAERVYQATSPIRVLYVSPERNEVLFSERDGLLKQISVLCN